MSVESANAALAHPKEDPEKAREEVTYLETRLAEIGDDDLGSAYVKAMMRFYRFQIAARREQLREI